MFAKTEMLQFIRGRPIDCAPTQNVGEDITTRCSLDAFDISGWLVLTGWAKPKGDFFTDELAEARDKKRGIWRTERP